MHAQVVFRPSAAAFFLPPIVVVLVVVCFLSGLRVISAFYKGAVWESVIFIQLEALLFVTPIFIGSLLLVYLYERLRAPVFELSGVTALDPLQRRRYTPWGQIHAAELETFMSRSVLKLSVAGTVWRLRVTVYRSQRNDLTAIVSALAGSEHPASRALRGEA